MLWNPRDFAANSYRTVDDRPYGGGPGMVMMAEPLAKAIAAARAAAEERGRERAARGVPLAAGPVAGPPAGDGAGGASGLVLLAGRYEGVDERLIGRAVDDEVSIGDYVLSGGELAAMVVIDCIVRQLPGALGDAESASQDSFVNGLLDCPHYTRPEVYEGEAVPAVLLSGNHAEIARWRLKQALGRTWRRRPDLLEKRGADAEDERELLEELQEQRSEKGA